MLIDCCSTIQEILVVVFASESSPIDVSALAGLHRDFALSNWAQFLHSRGYFYELALDRVFIDGLFFRRQGVLGLLDTVTLPLPAQP
jgi:hypothetical protein